MSLRRVVLLVLPLVFGLALVGAVRATSGFERRIASDQAESARVITYVADPGAPVHVPLQLDAEVVRVVVHAYWHGALAPSRHAVKVSISVRGGVQVLAFDAPGTATRASAETGDVQVGDPIALNVDVPPGGPGDLTLLLDSIDGADGILLRAYERESLGVVDALQRRSGLTETRQEHLARRAGEADWVDLDSSERAALIAARWRKVVVLAEGGGSAPSRAVTLRAPGSLDAQEAVPATAPRDDLRPVAYYRALPDRPVVVSAGPEPLVVRVSARRALARSVPDASALVLTASFEAPGHETLTSNFQATVDRSAHDRYASLDGDLAPSEPAVFYVLVPADGHATLRPVEGPVDVSLSELDPSAPPRSRPPRSEGDASEPEADPSPAFAFRRPSNAADFGPDARGVVLVASRATASAPPPPQPPSTRMGLARVVRPRVPEILHRHGRLFEPASVRFTVDAGPGPVVLAAQIVSGARTHVVASIDGGQPRRRWAGIAQRLTRSVAVTVDGEARATVVIGDDLQPGAHELSFAASPSTPVWVHFPWVHRGAPQMGESAWITGGFP
jgi:hypothetical protein